MRTGHGAFGAWHVAPARGGGCTIVAPATQRTGGMLWHSAAARKTRHVAADRAAVACESEAVGCLEKVELGPPVRSAAGLEKEIQERRVNADLAANRQQEVGHVDQVFDRRNRRQVADQLLE